MNFIFLLAILAASPLVSAGVLIGNGGDSLYCIKVEGSAKFPQDGFYVLDYVVRFPEDGAGIVPVAGLNASLDRIENLIRAKAPEALSSFLSFRATVSPVPFLQTSDRKWTPVDKGLENIRDEYAKRFPRNCSFKHPGKNEVYGVYQQTVVRKRSDSRKVVYKYDRQIMNDYLSRADAMQASIILVHEWLWDYYEGATRGAAKIRGANLFLHSKLAEDASPAEFAKAVLHSESGI